MKRVEDVADGFRATKRLPFALDRASRDSFKCQLAEGLREAIRIGYYRAGDMLPSLSQAVADLGVSDIVVRGAYRTLSAEGMVVSRKGLGSVVRPSRTPVWRGHVLCVTTDFDFSLVQCGIVEKLRERLTSSGYLFSQVAALTARNRKVDLRRLDRSLLRPVDFIFLTQSVREIEHRLSETGVPFAIYGRGPEGLPKGCVGTVSNSFGRAVTQFVAQCQKRNLKHVEIVCCERIGRFAGELMGRLAAARIQTTAGWVRTRWGVERVEVAERSGYDFVRRNLRRKSCRLPDLYYVCDDCVARGMLQAFAESGVKIPEQVRLVCSLTAGFRPVFGKSVASVLSAPYEIGEEVARRVHAWLTERRPFPVTPIEARYVDGETFP